MSPELMQSTYPGFPNMGDIVHRWAMNAFLGDSRRSKILVSDKGFSGIKIWLNLVSVTLALNFLKAEVDLM